jgi:transcriptional regulator with XRE-family HTH domain
VVVEELRTNKSLTRSEVAKRAKVAILWIQRLETNQLHTDYTIRKLDQVAHAPGVELYDFYERTSEMTGAPPWPCREGRQQDEKAKTRGVGVGRGGRETVQSIDSSRTLP